MGRSGHSLIQSLSLIPLHLRTSLTHAVKDRPATLARRIKAAETTQALEAQIRATQRTPWLCMCINAITPCS